MRIGDHVLQHRPEPMRRGINLRLRFLAQVDDLGVTAALEVEDAVRTPAMLVIANERPLRITAERRLAGAR